MKQVMFKCDVTGCESTTVVQEDGSYGEGWAFLEHDIDLCPKHASQHRQLMEGVEDAKRAIREALLNGNLEA